MKRILTIIVVTVLIFLIGFVFLRLNNEEFAENMLDDAGLNSHRIRTHRAMMMSGATMSGDVSTGAMMSGESMTGMMMTGTEMTGASTSGSALLDVTGSVGITVSGTVN